MVIKFFNDHGAWSDGIYSSAFGKVLSAPFNTRTSPAAHQS
jgi:hypothetical protein